MMKNLRKQILLAGCGLAIMLTFSCSKDNPLNTASNCNDGNWAEQYHNEFQLWSDAGQAYNENPNATTCASYKNAAKAYLNALESIYNCVPTLSRGELEQLIEEAKTDIDSGNCNS